MKDANVTLYDRILKASNREYNIGLEKARVRDLSGAVNYLNRALRLNKNHTDARNLLGLIYYEMGDLVEALSQWVISKNLNPDSNMADGYLDKLQSNQGRMDAINQNIKKYNQALAYASKGSEDLAIMQLKKVLANNKNFVKGYQFLALLYLHKGEYEKAKKAIYQILRIDKNNTLALEYMNEVKGGLKRERRSTRTEKKQRSGEMEYDDVIVPSTYRENTGWQSILLILCGVLLGAGVAYFIILPIKMKDFTNSRNELVIGYNDKLMAKDNIIADMEKEIEKLNDSREQMEKNLSAYTDTSTGIISEYNALLLALNYVQAGKYAEAAVQFTGIEPDAVTDETFQSVYGSLRTTLEAEGWQPLYTEATKAFGEGRYEDAKEFYLKCLRLKPDYADALYWLGYSYENLGDKENADLYYTKTIETKPNSAAARDAKERRGN